jgi:hypothetical protein
MKSQSKWLWLAGLVGLAIGTGKPFLAANDRPAISQPNSGGASVTLPVGAICNVQTIRSGQQFSHSGRIAKVGSEWLVLKPIQSARNLTPEESRGMAELPILDPRKLAYLSLLMQNEEHGSETTKDEEIWIPRETILRIAITSHREIPAAKQPSMPFESTK